MKTVENYLGILYLKTVILSQQQQSLDTACLMQSGIKNTVIM